MCPSGDKTLLRRSVLARRAALPPDPTRGAAWADALGALTEGLARVAAYASFGTEPPTGALLDRLTAEVLLPVLLPDRDLDWSAGGPPLGADAVASCGLVVVPALAVDRRGVRLGRGGGSYDRVLGRVPAGVPTVALLHDGELLDAVPAEPHDRRVSAAVLPTRGVVRLPRLDERDRLTHQ